MSRYLPTLIALGCCGLVAAGQVWLSHMRIELTQKTQKTQDERTALSHELQGLRLEVASLSRPERLRRLAQTKLDMAPPRPMQVLQP